MKPIYKHFVNSKIVFIVICLLSIAQTAICCGGTEAESDTFHLDNYKQEVARDLQYCDLVKKERDVLRSYNTDLVKENNTVLSENETVKRKAEKDRVKVKRRGKTIAVLILIDISVIAAKIFL